MRGLRRSSRPRTADALGAALDRAAGAARAGLSAHPQRLPGPAARAARPRGRPAAGGVGRRAVGGRADGVAPLAALGLPARGAARAGLAAVGALDGGGSRPPRRDPGRAGLWAVAA